MTEAAMPTNANRPWQVESSGEGRIWSATGKTGGEEKSFPVS